jgi:hypothetical protein
MPAIWRRVCDRFKELQSGDRTIPESNISKISVSGGVAGLIVTLVILGIFLAALPPVRWFLAASLPLGAVAALILRWTARDRD